MRTSIALLAASFVLAGPALAQEGANKPGSGPTPPQPTSDTRKAATKAGTVVVRQAAGRAIGATAGGTVGKTVGRVVGGGPIGAAVGVVLTPSEIGCGEGETCR